MDTYRDWLGHQVNKISSSFCDYSSLLSKYGSSDHDNLREISFSVLTLLLGLTKYSSSLL
jgi:hypothetical protein